jgi:hypothetical protein
MDVSWPYLFGDEVRIAAVPQRHIFLVLDLPSFFWQNIWGRSFGERTVS